ncbi:MAG: helix-turn-helix domain-containing protein [bacterium]|nr:helix-turn-helix domain-containing protein [bacterium]
MKLNIDLIKRIRRKRGLKVKELAKDLGITENSYYRWERGEFIPKQNDVRVLAELLMTDVSYISDLQSFKQYNDLYTQVEMNKLFNKEDVPIEMQESLIKLDNFFISLKNENKILKLQNSRLLEFYYKNRIASYYKDERLIFIGCNNSFEKLFGSKAMYISKTSRSIFAREEAEILTKLEREVLNTAQPIDYYKIKLFNNSYLFFGTKVTDIAKKAYIVGSLVDIESYERIISKYSTYGSILDHFEGAIWAIKTKPYIHYELLSRKIEKITGYPYDTIKDNPHKWRQIVHPEDLGKCIPFNLLVKEEEFYKKPYFYRIITAENKIKWIKERIYYEAKTDKFIGIIVDSTKEKENE